MNSKLTGHINMNKNILLIFFLNMPLLLLSSQEDKDKNTKKNSFRKIIQKMRPKEQSAKKLINFIKREIAFSEQKAKESKKNDGVVSQEFLYNEARRRKQLEELNSANKENYVVGIVLDFDKASEISSYMISLLHEGNRPL